MSNFLDARSAKKLYDWYEQNKRELPWRETSEPYKIWISEIILQQTQVKQALAYYKNFLEIFPSVRELALANNDLLMKMWEGLGYYSRAKNLHHTAKVIYHEKNGEFPNNFKDLLKLKGIGDYTARAIASFAFGEEVGVLDGNVFRVLSRLLADKTPIDQSNSRKHYQKIVDDWAQKSTDIRIFNQAIMEFGATHCTFRSFNCETCILQEDCLAKKLNSAEKFPLKSKRRKRKTVYFHFRLVKSGNKIAIRKRESEKIWHNLWEVPNKKITKEVWENLNTPAEFKHILTHMDLMIKAEIIESDFLERDFTWISIKEVQEFAFPRAIQKIFEKILFD